MNWLIFVMVLMLLAQIVTAAWVYIIGENTEGRNEILKEDPEKEGETEYNGISER